MTNLKFRAWDTEKRIFVPSGEIIFSFYGDTRIEVYPNDISYIGDPIHNGEPQRGRFIVMQFTGLLDKNGKEIYEGDLLRRQFRVYWIVEFCSGEWRANPKHKTGLYLSYDQFQETEIVGNIYENPQLLNS